MKVTSPCNPARSPASLLPQVQFRRVLGFAVQVAGVGHLVFFEAVFDPVVEVVAGVNAQSGAVETGHQPAAEKRQRGSQSQKRAAEQKRNGVTAAASGYFASSPNPRRLTAIEPPASPASTRVPVLSLPAKFRYTISFLINHRAVGCPSTSANSSSLHSSSRMASDFGSGFVDDGQQRRVDRARARARQPQEPDVRLLQDVRVAHQRNAQHAAPFCTRLTY